MSNPGRKQQWCCLVPRQPYISRRSKVQYMLIPRQMSWQACKGNECVFWTGIPSDGHATGHTDEEVQRDTEVAASQQLPAIGMKVRP
jgi:hypothetical protein